MKNGLPFGIIAIFIAGLCACTPPPPSTATSPRTASAAAPRTAGPATTAPAQPAAAPADATPDETSPAAAEAVVRTYYAAIDARDFAAAYAQWSDGGAASGQSFEHFRNGYANTASVEAEVGTATDEEGADAPG